MDDNTVFSERRQRVLEAIRPGAMLLFAAPVAYRNHDVEHEYRQDSDFFFLTGFEEPESALLLSTVGEQASAMFVRPRDGEREVWDGARLGVEGAVDSLGADVAYPIGELAKRLPKLLEDVPRLYYELGRTRDRDDTVLAAIASLRGRVREGLSWPTQIIEPGSILHPMRVIKSTPEVEAMSRAARITCEAHREAMVKTAPRMFEYEIDALLRGTFRRHGSPRMAYSPVVGSGPNATVLHYRRTDRQLQAGDLLLVDAGCEIEYYAADVTRTFPVTGRFSPDQAAVYDVVLEAQLAAIQAVRPGATLDDVHRAAVEVIAGGLIRLGVIPGPAEEAIAEERYKPFYMHRTSHFLGMDVHDVGRSRSEGKPVPLQSGMVITVEPGLYFAESAPDAAARYRGIGVRIEDDVLVTEQGSTVLTLAAPKEREDVERVCTG
jgi:Xaa-Pro aminopeptidase